MANISRYDPFEMTVEPFDDLFRGFFRPVRFEGQAQPMQIKVDVKENDTSYTVHADIPGVKKEDIHVTIDGNQVSISAEMKKKRKRTAISCCAANAISARFPAASRWNRTSTKAQHRPNTTMACWNWRCRRKKPSPRKS